jgi:hypothetical protein
MRREISAFAGRFKRNCGKLLKKFQADEKRGYGIPPNDGGYRNSFDR